MATLIGEVKEMKGDYFLKGTDGIIKKVEHGDSIHEGDTLYGAKDNTLENALLVMLVLSGKEVILMGDESQRFDPTLLSIVTDESIAQTDPLSVALLNDAIQEHLNSADDHLYPSTSNDPLHTPDSTGISTSVFTQHDAHDSNVTAKLSDTDMTPSSADPIHPGSHNITGIVDLDAAIHHSDITTDSTAAIDIQKSVHREVLQAAMENTKTPNDLTEKEASDVFADQDSLLDKGFDTLLTSNAYTIDYDDISSNVREVQLSHNSDPQTIKTLSIEDVLDITPEDDHILRINGDSDDAVGLRQDSDDTGSSSQWTKATKSVIDDDGHTYDIYTGTSGSETITLQIDQNITVTDF